MIDGEEIDKNIILQQIKPKKNWIYIYLYIYMFIIVKINKKINQKNYKIKKNSYKK